MSDRRAAHSRIGYGAMMTDNPVVNWFLPSSIAGRTKLEMARVFVFTHLLGPVIAQPLVIGLYIESPSVNVPLVVLISGVYGFLLLPFLLKKSGDIRISGLISFSFLAALSLYGSYYYGRFSSPFTPWLIVSMLLGFLYLPKNPWLVMSIFAANIGIFLLFILTYGFPETLPEEKIRILSWLSLLAATVYMCWMALYYARIIALRSDLKYEAERFRMTLEKLEKARQHAEHVSHQKSLFFSKMSHELRTPLNVIIGYAEILLEDAAEDSGNEEGFVKQLSRISAAGRHLLSLVSSVLDSKKLAKEEDTLDISEFTLGDLRDEVIANALPIIRKNGNRFDVDCRQSGMRLRTDRTKLRQMLINLLSTAGKFTKDGVVSMQLDIEENQADDRFHAKISDTGIGIAPESLSKLFESYMQADASIAAKFGGTGMGLAISRKIAVLLGGEISVESTVGVGSVFKIDIPAYLEMREKGSAYRGTPADIVAEAA